jgi:hypothetical protein
MNAIVNYAIFAYMAVCTAMICRKMGYSPFLGVVTFVPGIGIGLAVILFWFMAFAKWPRWEEAGLE